tara:strand:- start:268 stop:717 length:450 start_codon:yes stop_codon:yes gene_type:complete
MPVVARKSNREHTIWPTLYKDTYWGQGNMGNPPDPAIVANRNRLGGHLRKVNDRHLPNYVMKAAFPGNPDMPYGERHCDHTECYTNVHGDWVVLTSPYYGRVKEDEPLPDWALLPKMYDQRAMTYACRIPKRGRRGSIPKSAMPWTPFA